MIAALLALAAMSSVADAERAFAAGAQANGQWTAFRATAAPEATLYAPGPVPAARWLSGRSDPAQSPVWRPAHTITACDASLAYSAGPWRGPAGRGGFGTIWRHDASGWRWLYDERHTGDASFADGTIEDRAACPGPVGSAGAPPRDSGTIPLATLRANALAGLIEAGDGLRPVALTIDPASAEGGAIDRTLLWRINPIAGGRIGAHLLRLWSWDGRRYRLAVLAIDAGG